MGPSENLEMLGPPLCVQLLFVSVLSMELKGQPDRYSQSDCTVPTVYFLLVGQGL